MLTHRATAQSAGWPPKPSTGCGGGHLYSEDLLTWYFGEPAFGHSAADSGQCDVRLEPNGTTIKLTSRQRPTVLDSPDGRRYLYTGASGPDAAVTECACRLSTNLSWLLSLLLVLVVLTVLTSCSLMVQISTQLHVCARDQHEGCLKCRSCNGNDVY